MGLSPTETRPTKAEASYEVDTVAWALQQEAVLRDGRVEALDWPNLADEVADVSRRERDRLVYLLERLIQQQLIYDHDPRTPADSRTAAIGHQRRRVCAHLVRFPSLMRHRTIAVGNAYKFGRLAALRESGLSDADLPRVNPYTWSHLLKDAPDPRPELMNGRDVHAWATRQSHLLRQRRFAELDRSKLADEIADVARRDYLRLRRALMQILQHLLKWDHQPERRSRSWVLSIAEHRERVKLLLAEHPSLAGRRSEALQAAYRLGRIAALRDTGLPEHILPEINSYAWEIVMARPIVWPDPSSQSPDFP